MKLAYVDLCGFRGYRKRLRIDFADDFTIIDGRNGVGKSTIFDAVEYALTGHLRSTRTKVTVKPCRLIWWTGRVPPPPIDTSRQASGMATVSFLFVALNLIRQTNLV
ncbi:MAG: AAA family ATPase [Pseudoxanthomonas sp.]